MRKFLLAAVIVLGSSGAAFGQVRVTGAGAKLGDLVGSPTLVTVVLKGGVKDANLKVASVNGATVTFLTDKGEQAIYTASNIEEIQVQGGAVEKKQVVLLTDVMAPADKQVVERAFARAKEIYDNAAQEQNVKIHVAALLALNGDEDVKKYLTQLSSGGDIQTSLEASKSMYLAGMPVPDQLLRQGLDSGNRVVRGTAAELSGLTKYTDAASLLVRLANDRAWEISGPACRAVARLGNREIVPTLLSGLNERNEEKAAAVMWAIMRLGGDDLREQLKLHLPQTSGMEKFRTTYLLYRMGDPDGKKLMIGLMAEMPTLQLDAAVALGQDGDVSAMDALRQRLRRREDETEDNLINRARAAEALVKGGDPAPKGVLQELMRSPKKKVRLEVFNLVARLNNRTMLSLMQSSIENIENPIASEACISAVALGNSAFRGRLLDLRAAEEAAVGEKAKGAQR